MPEILEYVDEEGRQPFSRWFEELNAAAAARVTAAIARLGQGNYSSVKAVGEGVSELKIDFGPGYRVYFGQDGGELVILLAGGTKKRQARDISRAQMYWADYRRRKRQEMRR